jgi:hypothetical protein
VLQNNFLINKINKSYEEEGALYFMSALGEHSQDEVHVPGGRRSSLISQKFQHLHLCPISGCSHLVSKAEQMFYILDMVLPPACWVGAMIVFSSILLKESRSVTVDTMGEGEKQIYLFNL